MPISLSRRFILLAAASVLLSISALAGTFKNPELIDTSYDPQGVATGDWDGDGIPDLAYVDGASPSTLHILLGNGNGTFLHKQDIALPEGIGSVINVADVTSDGILDIVIGGSTSTAGKIATFIGNGDGTFQSPVVSTITNSGGNGGTPSLDAIMGIGDVNGDGAADLVIGDAMSATLYVLFGNNSGRFSIGTKITFYFSGEADSFLYDLNGDGHLDIVVNNLVGAQTIVWLGNGDGTFQPGVSYTSYAVTLADVNGDGHPDLVGEVYPGQVQVLLGNSDGTFGLPAPLTTVPAGDFLAKVGDFNGDGIPDLLFMTPEGVGVALGQGNLTYGSVLPSVAGTVAPSRYLPAFIQGDFNGDGHRDIALAAVAGIVVLLGNGDGTFASADWYDTGHTVGAVAVADFSGDNIPDIAASVQATYPRLLVGNGSGQFTLAPDQNQTYGSQTASTSMGAGDFNGDGNNDLYMLVSTQAYPFGQPFIFFGSGNDTFTTPLALSAGPAFVGDVNGDGRSDLVSLGDGVILTFLGQKNETFSQVSTQLIHPTYSLAALGDVNRDGKPDLLTLEYPAIRVWLGNGDGTFTQSSLLSAPSEQVNLMSAAIADLDGDGNPDIIAVSYPNEIGTPYPLVIYYGSGDGTFQDPVLLPITHSYTQLVIADINGDNKPDLILSDGNCIAVIDNLGARSFAPEEHYVAGQKISGLAVKDLNNDGFPDIVAANAGGTTVVVLLNQPNGNPIDGAPSNGVFTITPEPAQYGQPVTLSITMSSPSGPVPTGSVSFSVDGSFIATVKLSNSTAAYNYTGVLITGLHTFVATYEGDKNYAPESFALLHQVTPPIYSTTTVLVASPTTVLTSQTVSLQATVSSAVQIPNGTVTFFDGTNTLGSRTFVPYGSQTVIFDTNLLAAGTHSLTATYQGWQDPFGDQEVFEPSTSTPVTVIVNSTPTSTALQASSTSPTAGTVVTFTANVTSSPATPFGGVTFYDGPSPLGTSSLLGDGSCTFSTASLGVGTHSITAAYNANATFAGSTSPVVTVAVSAANGSLTPTAVRIAVTSDGEQSALLANVGIASGTAMGTVTFLDAGTVLGTVSTDASGTATLQLSQFGTGAHNLSASYAGSPLFAPAVSPVLVEQIPASGGDFSLSLSPQTIDLLSTNSGTALLTVVPTASLQQQIQLSCTAGLPPGYGCSFSPASLYSGTSNLQIQRSLKSETRQSVQLLYAVGAGIVCFFSVGTGGRRLHLLALMLICLGLVMLDACGASPSGQTQLGVLSIQASAGTGSSPVVHSAQVFVKFRP